MREGNAPAVDQPAFDVPAVDDVPDGEANVVLATCAVGSVAATLMSTPRRFGSCACAACGHAIAEVPRRVMNSRRPM